jgi:predicted DNA-binding transcriptional regulator AlpA
MYDARNVVTHHLDTRAGDIADAIANTASVGMADPDELLDTTKVAALLGCSVQWLHIGRCKNYGPPFIKVSPRCVRYRRSALVTWLHEREYRSTAEVAPDLISKPGPGHPGSVSAI